MGSKGTGSESKRLCRDLRMHAWSMLSAAVAILEACEAVVTGEVPQHGMTTTDGKRGPACRRAAAGRQRVYVRRDPATWASGFLMPLVRGTLRLPCQLAGCARANVWARVHIMAARTVHAGEFPVWSN